MSKSISQNNIVASEPVQNHGSTSVLAGREWRGRAGARAKIHGSPMSPMMSPMTRKTKKKLHVFFFYVNNSHHLDKNKQNQGYRSCLE